MRRIILLALLTIAVPAYGFAQVTKEETKKQPMGRTNVEQTLIKLDRDLIDGMLRKDRALADRVEVENSIFINPGGGLEVRGHTMGAGPTIESLTPSDVTVRVYGDTAILTGFADVKGSFPSGPDISGQYRYMRVFVKQKGDWRLVASTATQIKPAPMPPKT